MSKDGKALARSIQSGLFTAKFNYQYHDMLVRRYERIDKVSKVTLALAAVAIFALGRFLPQHSQSWQITSAAISMLSTSVLPLFRWSKLIPQIEAQRQNWIRIRQEYENLWADVKRKSNWKEAEAEFKRIRKRENATEPQGGLIPNIPGLLRKAQQQVCASQGLTVA